MVKFSHIALPNDVRIIFINKTNLGKFYKKISFFETQKLFFFLIQNVFFNFKEINFELTEVNMQKIKTISRLEAEI